MAVDKRFMLTGAKRVFDSRPLYAQVVVTDDCNLTCSYCDEYAPGAPIIPLETLRARVDKLDELGVLVYDFLGGETLLHPSIAELVAHVKAKRGGSNLATIITNGFLLTRQTVSELNAAGLDFMQISVDSLRPTGCSDKSLKSALPKLRLLAETAKFQVEIQSVLNEENLNDYDEFRAALKGLPFAFGFSIMHGRGGQIAIRGEKYLDLLERYGVFEGVNFYGEHLQEMLRGDFSRPWKCLGGFKFLYVNSAGAVQWCAQRRGAAHDLMAATPRRLRADDAHKPCEAGCALGCVRMISHTLGEPLKTLGASLKLAAGMRTLKKAALLLLASSALQAAPSSPIVGAGETLRDALAAVPEPPARATLGRRVAAALAAGQPRRICAIPELAAQLRRLDEDPQVRAAAALSLGRIGDPLAAPALMEAHNDPIAEVRAQAAQALGRVPADGVASRLEKVLRSEPDWRARLAAAGALSRTRKPFVARALSEALDGDPAWQVRRQAVRSLQDLGTPAAAAALERALNDPDPGVRAAAAAAVLAVRRARP